MNAKTRCRLDPTSTTSSGGYDTRPTAFARSDERSHFVPKLVSSGEVQVRGYLRDRFSTTLSLQIVQLTIALSPSPGRQSQLGGVKILCCYAYSY